MKRLLLLFTLIISTISFSQEIKTIKWEEVILTTNPNDLAGYTRIDEIDAKASKVFGAQKKLRAKASESLKKEAAKLGAELVFIQKENFSNSPINNYYFIGVAYKKAEVAN